MNPTRPGPLLIAAGIAFVTAYLLMRAFYLDSLNSALPRSPVISVGIAALALGQLGRAVRARLEGRPHTKPIMPIAVARFAALARASGLAAAFIGGAWIGVLAYTAPRGSQPAVAGADTITAALGIGSAAALLAGALWLERGCRQR